MSSLLWSFTLDKLNKMTKPQFTFKTEEEIAGFSRFIIEPLPQGFGDTLGNSLRRVLLTAIPGAAITSVQISGVNHQFTSLEGMQEDIVDLILSLKQVRISYAGEKPTRMTLDISGTGEVTAGQFETPADVKIANPELVIGHLNTKNSHLEIQAVVESGFGYSPAEDRKSTTLGIIPMDATFAPVTRVNYHVESTRVGRMTNFDKLVIEVFTNGTIVPNDAIISASQTLVNYFSGIVNPDFNSESSAGTVPSLKTSVGSNVSVEELDLPTRISNALQKAGFQTVADILAVPRAQLSKVKNLGGKSVDIIAEALIERGFELAQ
jgi:DNA-directed RNA polymerase subunit alpha